MKLHELIKVLDYNQDEITLVFRNDNNVKSTFKRLTDIPITYSNYNVIQVYGYDAEGYDGIEISLVEE